MRERWVVTCFLQHRGRILLLRRSKQVSTHRGKWAGVSGTIDAASPYEQALAELREETSLEAADVRLVRQGEPLEVEDPENAVLWRVHPFLFCLSDPTRVRLDWEHVKSRWIDPDELDTLDTVPRLKETWERVAQASPSA